MFEELKIIKLKNQIIELKKSNEALSEISSQHVRHSVEARETLGKTNNRISKFIREQDLSKEWHKFCFKNEIR